MSHSQRHHRVSRIRKRRTYHLEDLYLYVRPYGLPLEEESSLSKIGYIVRQYLYDRIEFKVNCRMGMEDRLITCCSSLLPATHSSPSSSSSAVSHSFSLRNKNKKKHYFDDIASNTDFFVALNVRRAQSGDEPNPVLFTYPQYSESNLSTSSRCIQLDFLVRKQIKCMVMATYIAEHKPSRKTSSKSRRGSSSAAASTKQHRTCTAPNSPALSSESNENPKFEYGSNSYTNGMRNGTTPDLPRIAPISISAKPFAKSKRVKFQSKTPRASKPRAGSNFNNNFAVNRNAPSMIPAHLAIIYPQDNILWSYFQNKARMIEQNAWLPILSLWRQHQPNIVYMLRGSNASCLPSTVSAATASESDVIRSKKRAKSKRSQSVHERTFTPSAPIPDLSTLELSSGKSKKSKKAAHSVSNADVVKLPIIGKRKKKKKKHANSKSNYFGNNIYKHEDEKENPCRLYQITVTQDGVQCENLFDFPHLNVQHELTWFDAATKSLLVVLNNEQQNSIQLQIIRNLTMSECANMAQSNHNALAQSMTDQLQLDAVSSIASSFKRRKRKKDSKKKYKHSAGLSSTESEKQRQMSASQQFHEKLANETLRIPVDAPSKHGHIFRDCQCLKFWHHAPSNSFLLLLEKYESAHKSKKSKINSKKKKAAMEIPEISASDGILGKLLLKLRINFQSVEIEHVSFGIVNEEDNEVITDSNIVGYDYHRQLLIIDTYYEPISPLSTNPLRSLSGKKRMGPSPSSSSDMYQQYNKWFSFASKKLSSAKHQVVTKRFTAVGINDFVYHWKTIYDVNKFRSIRI